MKNRHLKYISLLIIFLIIESCSTFKIHSAEKNLVIPGVSKAKKYTLYKVEFESEQNFSIDKIVLGKTPVDKFSLYNTSTKLYENSENINLKKGVYLLSFKSFNLNSNVGDNTVTLFITQANKTKEISTEIKTTDTIHKR